MQLKRINVVRDHTPLCHSCIAKRREAEARAAGVTLLHTSPTSRKHGIYRLSCGHVVTRQFIRVQKAATGGHKIGCEACREARYARESEKHGWKLIGPASDNRAGYRSYEHTTCGHMQDVSIGNMLWGDCTCAKCGKGWPAKTSYIYLFQIALPDGPVLKLGYSARPAKRLKHQLGLGSETEVQILRVLPMPTGHDALTEETSCHRFLKQFHPDLAVPKNVFGDAINTQSEIYTPAAEAVIHQLLDDVESRFPASSMTGD